jgi:hypothetical protein
LLAGFCMEARLGGLPEKMGVLEQQARQRQDPLRFDRIASLALAIMRNTQDPEVIELANSVANAATLIQANPELREAYEPVLLRCIERLRASMRG